jgi:CubicO group peptidase (beta-lactamase class C family)
MSKTTSLLPKLAIVLLLLLTNVSILFSQVKIRQDVESYLQAICDSFPGVPGIHVIVVDQDGISFRASAGYADIENKIPFIPETGLYIASNTKSFVGLAMAKLIDDKKIGFNDPITAYLNRKDFPDSIDVDHIYVRDLPGHTHGLSNDVMTFRTAFTGTAPDSILPELLKYTSYAFQPPEKKFRYNNFSYLMCGMIIEKVTGMSWRDYLVDSILIPVGMIHTTPYYSDYEDRPLAANYLFNNPNEELNFSKQDNTMHAAGGLVSTDGDMALWLQLFMNNGKIGNRQYLDSTYFIRAKTLLAYDTGNMGPFQRYGYTYGWLKGRFNGEAFYFHFGQYTGLGCMMSFMPDKNLGVFAFTNEGVGGLFISALATTYIYDRILEKENTTKISDMIKEYVRHGYANHRNEKLVQIEPDNMPFNKTLNLKNDAYGELQFYRRNKSMMVRFGNMVSPVYQGDSTGFYKVEWVPGDQEWLKISNTEKGTEVQYENYGVFVEE